MGNLLWIRKVSFVVYKVLYTHTLSTTVIGSEPNPSANDPAYRAPITSTGRPSPCALLPVLREILNEHTA